MPKIKLIDSIKTNIERLPNDIQEQKEITENHFQQIESRMDKIELNNQEMSKIFKNMELK